MGTLMNELYKSLYRITHQKSYHHNRKRWPYVKIERNKNGELTKLVYKKKNIPLITLSSVKNKFSGPILVAATGPSVKNITFNEKPIIPVMGVNGAYFLKSKIDFNFYVITDIHFPDHRPDILEKVVSDKKIILFAIVDVIIKIINMFPSERINCSFSAIEDYEEKIYQKKKTARDVIFECNKDYIHSNSDGIIGFSSNISNGVFSGKTVVYWALQIITHLGFNDIYIIGLDMNNFDKPRFYETNDDKIHTQLPDDIELIIASLKHASEVLKNKLNVNVINLSKYSSISEEIFKKADYKEYEKNICFKQIDIKDHLQEIIGSNDNDLNSRQTALRL